MNRKKRNLYNEILEQGLIYKSDADDLNESLMELFEKEISKKQDRLNDLNKKKEILRKGISSKS